MLYPVFLLTADAALRERVHRALAGSLPLELHCSPELLPPPVGRAWLAILLDAAVVTPQSAATVFLTAEPLPTAPPILWLGQSPQLTAAVRLLPGWYERVIDYLDRNWSVSKLTFSLQQHLQAAYLRRNRQPAPAMAGAPPDLRHDSCELQQKINNALTGIVGNAELLLEPGRRLPPPLHQRLTRITDLSGEMRDLVLLWSSHTACYPSHTQSSS